MGSSVAGNGAQHRDENDIVRDLPPKSPNTRRTMPKVPAKTNRGEVKDNLTCVYQWVLYDWSVNTEKMLLRKKRYSVCDNSLKTAYFLFCFFVFFKLF